MSFFEDAVGWVKTAAEDTKNWTETAAENVAKTTGEIIEIQAKAGVDTAKAIADHL